MSLSLPIPSPDGKKLFADGWLPRGELVRYDGKSREFVPFLSGISVDQLDFSRDGKWVVYVSNPDGTLWRSRADGSERLQLTSPPFCQSCLTGLPMVRRSPIPIPKRGGAGKPS